MIRSKRQHTLYSLSLPKKLLRVPCAVSSAMLAVWSFLNRCPTQIQCRKANAKRLRTHTYSQMQSKNPNFIPSIQYCPASLNTIQRNASSTTPVHTPLSLSPGTHRSRRSFAVLSPGRGWPQVAASRTL